MLAAIVCQRNVNSMLCLHIFDRWDNLWRNCIILEKNFHLTAQLYINTQKVYKSKEFWTCIFLICFLKHYLCLIIKKLNCVVVSKSTTKIHLFFIFCWEINNYICIIVTKQNHTTYLVYDIFWILYHDYFSCNYFSIPFDDDNFRSFSL